MVVLRQKHQQAPCNADLRRQPRALGAERVFEHLHHQGLAFKQLFFNRLDAGCWHIGVGMAVIDAAHQISDMQESCFVQPNVYKCRLHAGQHARYFSQVDIAHQTTLQ